MERVVYTKAGGLETIGLEPVKETEPKPEMVRVRVHRAGINFADLMMRQGLYGAAPDFPFTPGYEASGEISAIGEGVEGLEIGQRVLAMTGFGGYSQSVEIEAGRAIPLPDSMSFDAAAGLGVTYGTAYHMLVYLWNLQAGDSVLIHHAAGGVGTDAALICLAYGATNLIGTASSTKKEFVESLGMRFVDKDSEDFVQVCKKMTGGKGVNQAIDPVGGSHLLRSYKALCSGGKLHCFGASSAISGSKRSMFSALKMWRSTPKFDPLKMMNSNKAVFGVHMGRLGDESIFASHLQALSAMLEKGQIEPIIDSVWPYRKVADAQQHMHDRKNRGKILLDFS